MNKWSVIDLFSGAGGMSYGFYANSKFSIIGAVDFEVAKPSHGKGKLGCNDTYEKNIGLVPFSLDLSILQPVELYERVKEKLPSSGLTVLISCAPCTGFSRANPMNHLRDDPRNSLVTRSVDFVKCFQPEIFLMENARELVMGRFSKHCISLLDSLEDLGYKVHSSIHTFSRFGLPQKRERALVIAVKEKYDIHSLEELWKGHRINENAITVRRAIQDLPQIQDGETDSNDPMHVSPGFGKKLSLERLQAIPHDGGSWTDLISHPDAEKLLIPSMKRNAAKNKLGSHPDVYGRLWWDRPAVTIKRECAHIGNGRYAHPEQDRLLSVREMSILQGFPIDYVFMSSLANKYRHIGDAVPPLISYQLGKLCEWILSGEKPKIQEIILPKTSLRVEDIMISGKDLRQMELLPIG